MDWMYLFFFLLGMLLCCGACFMTGGRWNEEYTSLRQTKALQGIAALGVALHHMAQKTCAPWNPQKYIVHGLDFFIPIGYLFVGIFLFCSGLGLYRSLVGKPGYLKYFVRRRILPVVIAFYLSEIIYTAIRLLMGERMNALTVIWYLSGLHMANQNAWYVIVIPFFYLAFWVAFRFCRNEKTAVFCIFLFTLGYTVLGACIDHQNDWWMRGEWWYNTILLFPLGLLFGMSEQRVTAFLKKRYWFLLALSAAAAVLLFFLSQKLNGTVWGYYDPRSDPMRIPHRLMSAGLQWVVALAFVSFCFLMMLKVRIGNRVLNWLGGVTLAFYLMHGVFVELFGFNFLNIARSLVYIRNVPLFVSAVLACSVTAAALFHLLWRKLTAWILGWKGPDRNGPPQENGRTNHDRPRGKTEAKHSLRRLIGPALAVTALVVFLFFPPGKRNERIRVMNGLVFEVPEHYALSYTDSRYAVWQYEAEDKKPGRLILDGEIRDSKARSFSTVEDVLAECDWLAGTEEYVNPQGVRMVRGFSDYSGSPERRYYVESDKAMLLLCIQEDERFYEPADCEAAILQVAENVRRAD